MSENSLRVLSCVPRQLYSFEAKLRWVEEQAKANRPDLVVCPQEWHGGLQHFLFEEQGTTEKLAYRPAEIIDPYTCLAKKYNMGIAVGAVVDDPKLRQRRERIYIIDPMCGVTGHCDKMFLPSYDHIDAVGKTPWPEIGIHPETSYQARAVAFPVKGAMVSILFCWEALSDYLWHAISRAKPDLVVSQIKFGVRAWNQKKTVGFGFGADGGWVERLRMASKWEIAAPIVCSTNSWNLPKKAGALAGVILPWEVPADQEQPADYPARQDTLWESSGPGMLDKDHVQVDEIDYLYWRHVRGHYMAMRKATGRWAGSAARALTMSWKIKRQERRLMPLDLDEPEIDQSESDSVPVENAAEGVATAQ